MSSVQYIVLTTLLLVAVAPNGMAQEALIDFESAEIGKPMTSWTDKGVNFDLAHAPRKNKAKGRIMFFPNLGTEHKGILNAMAEEPIPLRITFSKPISKATLTLWGSTTSSALIEAFDHDGNVVAKQQLEQVPRRETPEDHVPFFDLTIESSRIEKILVSGSLAGGYIAVDQIQFTYAQAESANNQSESQSASSNSNR